MALTLQDLPAKLSAMGLTRAIDPPDKPHPRIRQVRDVLEDLYPGMHDKALTSGEMAKVSKLLSFYKDRHNSVFNEEADPLRYGWRVPAGKIVDQEIDRIRKVAKQIAIILCLGGNRAAKSHDAARRIIKLMVERPGAKVAVLCPSQGQAREVAMQYLWAHFPPEWKEEQTGKKKHGANGSYSYSLKTGFTEEAFTFANGSSLIFKYYVDGNVKNWEGGQYDAVWADEEVTQDWVDAALIRLATRNGFLLLTFTPISGMTPVVSSIQSDCDVVQEAMRDGRCERLQHAKLARLPTLERAPTKSIVYFWPKDNPYGGYESLVGLAISEKWTIDLIMCRLFGIAHKVKSAAFPTFSRDVHGWEPTDKEIEALHADSKKGKRPTWYQVVDPCDGRPFFMTWWLVLPGIGDKPRSRCVREWPQAGDDIPGWGDPGEWAVPSKDGKLRDGQRGPAQERQGHTVEFLHSEMDRVERELAEEFEGWTDGRMVEPFRRIMDCRGGNDTRMGEVTNETLIDLFYKFRQDGKPGRDFEDSSGKNLNPSSHRSGDGIHLINDWIGYRVNEPVDALNQPRMKIHTRCRSTMWALKNFTGADGSEGACKDPIDNVHYFVRSEPEVVDGKEWIVDNGRR